MFLTQQLFTVFGAPPLVYLMLLISGLDQQQGLDVAKLLLPPLTLVLGCAAPYFLIRLSVEHALATRPGEAPGRRLARILRVPSIVEAGSLIITLVTVSTFVGVAALRHGKSLWTVPWAIVALGLLMMMLLLQERVVFEDILRPHAVEEFHRAPTATPQGSGFLWPRQGWLLPYAFAVFVACSVVTTATIITTQVLSLYGSLQGQLASIRPEQFAPLLHDAVHELFHRSFTPMALVGSYLVLCAALAAWRMARHQTQAARHVQAAMEDLVRGQPRLPAWISTDEVGDLAAGTARILEQLRSLSGSLQDSARSLRNSAVRLGSSATQQTEVLTRQASALQETQVTAQEIKHTSVLASQRAESILAQTERADQLSVAGEAVLQQGMAGMQEIGEQVREMADSIRALNERARQIAHVTTLVKGLADRSNMLALNAAIEAVRSGEAGRGFAVVAREIRTLADQSIKATQKIGEILEDIDNAIGSSVSLMERGSERVTGSLRQLRDFSAHMQQISGIVRENATTVRQITAAVGQQDVGIAQIFQAVSELSKGMEQAMSQLQVSDGVLDEVRGVAEQVAGVVHSYGWQGKDEAAPPRP